MPSEYIGGCHTVTVVANELGNLALSRWTAADGISIIGLDACCVVMLTWKEQNSFYWMKIVFSCGEADNYSRAKFIILSFCKSSKEVQNSPNKYVVWAINIRSEVRSDLGTSFSSLAPN